MADRRQILAERFKTNLCKKHLETGSCPYQSRCMFAHGDHDLRTVEMNMADGLTSKRAIKAWLAARERGANLVGSASGEVRTSILAERKTNQCEKHLEIRAGSRAAPTEAAPPIKTTPRVEEAAAPACPAAFENAPNEATAPERPAYLQALYDRWDEWRAMAPVEFEADLTRYADEYLDKAKSEKGLALIRIWRLRISTRDEALLMCENTTGLVPKPSSHIVVTGYVLSSDHIVWYFATPETENNSDWQRRHIYSTSQDVVYRDKQHNA